VGGGARLAWRTRLCRMMGWWVSAIVGAAAEHIENKACYYQQHIHIERKYCPRCWQEMYVGERPLGPRPV